MISIRDHRRWRLAIACLGLLNLGCATDGSTDDTGPGFAFVGSGPEMVIFNLSTDQEHRRARVGHPVFGTAVHPDGHEAYATLFNKPAVVVVPLDDGPVTKIEVGERPRGLGLTPDGTRLFVANGDSDTVTVIDTASREVIASVDVAADPFDLAVHPEGGKVYVASRAGGGVSVIDARTFEVLETSQGIRQPNVLSISKDGRRLYVVSQENSLLRILDSESLEIFDVIEVTWGPSAMALDPGGSRLFMSHEKGSVSAYDAVTLEKLFESNELSVPSSLSTSRDGSRLFVVDRSAVAILATSNLERLGELALPHRAFAFGSFISPGRVRDVARTDRRQREALPSASVGTPVQGKGELHRSLARRVRAAVQEDGVDNFNEELQRRLQSMNVETCIAMVEPWLSSKEKRTRLRAASLIGLGCGRDLKLPYFGHVSASLADPAKMKLQQPHFAALVSRHVDTLLPLLPAIGSRSVVEKMLGAEAWQLVGIAGHEAVPIFQGIDDSASEQVQKAAAEVLELNMGAQVVMWAEKLKNIDSEGFDSDGFSAHVEDLSQVSRVKNLHLLPGLEAAARFVLPDYAELAEGGDPTRQRLATDAILELARFAPKQGRRVAEDWLQSPDLDRQIAGARVLGKLSDQVPNIEARLNETLLDNPPPELRDVVLEILERIGS
ncbi:MAG: hypothetical protein AAGM22_22930 [Acidobacteriota bacterium]